MKLNGQSNQSQRITKRKKKFEPTEYLGRLINETELHGDEIESKKE